MPPAHSERNTQRAIIAELLQSDDELQQLARTFVKLGMEEVVNQLTRGDAQTRATLAKQLAGPIVNAITEPAEEDQFGTIRAEFMEMMDEVRNEIMPPSRDVTVIEGRVLVKEPRALPKPVGDGDG